MPSVMVLSCCLKLLFLDLSNHTHTTELLVVNSINLLLNFLITFWVFCLGKTFDFCWKHRLLCKLAYLGYFMFLIFMIFNINKVIVFPIILGYAILVIFVTTLFTIQSHCIKK